MITRDGQKVLCLKKIVLHGVPLIYGILDREGSCETWKKYGTVRPNSKEDAHDLFFTIDTIPEKEKDEEIIEDIIGYLQCWNDFYHGDEPWEEYVVRNARNLNFMENLLDRLYSND